MTLKCQVLSPTDIIAGASFNPSGTCTRPSLLFPPPRLVVPPRFGDSLAWLRGSQWVWRGAVTVRGVEGHSGQSKGGAEWGGKKSQCKSTGSFPLLKDICPPPRGTPALRSSVSRPRLSALLEALRAIGTQGLPDHIVGLSGVFRLGDPRRPARRKRG